MSWTKLVEFVVIADLRTKGKSIGKPCGPIGQPRSRAQTRGKFPGVYTPARADQWRKQIRDAWDALRKRRIKGTAAFYRERFPIRGPIRLDVMCRFLHPKIHYKNHGKSRHLRDDAPMFRGVGDDCDNLAKIVMDALQVDKDHPCHPWRNDARIVNLRVWKTYVKHRRSQSAVISIYEWRTGNE